MTKDSDLRLMVLKVFYDNREKGDRIPIDRGSFGDWEVSTVLRIGKQLEEMGLIERGVAFASATAIVHHLDFESPNLDFESLSLLGMPLPQPGAEPVEVQAAGYGRITAKGVDVIESNAGDGQGEPNEKREPAEPTLPKRPGTGASRKDWYRYKYVCDASGVIKFSHAQLAEALSLAEGTARNYYSVWLAGAGKTDDAMTETGDTK